MSHTPAETDLFPPQKLSPIHLKKSLAACRKSLLAGGFFSLCINILMLTLPFYMLQLFDRVIGARSFDTLIYLTGFALFALIILAILDAIRARLFTVSGIWLEGRLAPSLLSVAIDRAKNNPNGRRGIQSLRDLQTIRGFLTGPSFPPLMDFPWTPIFLMVIFLLHPWLGIAATAGAFLLLLNAVVNTLITRNSVASSDMQTRLSLMQAEASVKNADAIMAMGIRPDLVSNWQKLHDKALLSNMASGILLASLSSLSKSLRMVLQVVMLGLGAYLVLQDQLTGGGMIASSILIARALAPVDQAISALKGLQSAKDSYGRIKKAMVDFENAPEKVQLPKPAGVLELEKMNYFSPGTLNPLLQNISFKLMPGESLGIIGPTASGKTTLGRLIVGNLKASSGHIRLDGDNIANRNQDETGRYLGYLPQDVEIFDASVAENIARLQKVDSDKVLTAAKQAGIHEMILHL
ncbi:MAG: ATP-binding cassette domain-containing protein, partial [Alphaproteobacteria bacterium]|nr:ATP-binding cassette domain-containing protein [Alphaproteobacteria bacterium]